MCKPDAKYFHVIWALVCAITLSYVASLHVDIEQTNANIATETSSCTFKVKSCKDISFKVCLLLPDGTHNVYDYILRGFRKAYSKFRWGSRVLRVGRPVSDLHCDQFQPYWASWKDGVLSTGSGWTVGQDVQMEYTTEFAKLHLIWIHIVFEYSRHAHYIFDDQNAAFLTTTPRSLYNGPVSTVVVTTLSIVRCAVACREEPRCAAISYIRDTKRCYLVGPFESDIKVASDELLKVTQRY